MASLGVNRPLNVAVVEEYGRLMRIYTELKGWQCKCNERELGKTTEFFGDCSEKEELGLERYYYVAKRTAELIASKLNLCGEKPYQMFKDYKILAAYDTDV